MARIGTFTGMGGGPYGASLSTVHPADNYVPSADQYDITKIVNGLPNVDTRPVVPADPWTHGQPITDPRGIPPSSGGGSVGVSWENILASYAGVLSPNPQPTRPPVTSGSNFTFPTTTVTPTRPRIR